MVTGAPLTNDVDCTMRSAPDVPILPWAMHAPPLANMRKKLPVPVATALTVCVKALALALPPDAAAKAGLAKVWVDKTT